MTTTLHFKVNCGFARAAIREFSEIGQGKHRAQQNQETTTEKFKHLFSTTPTYISSNSIFNSYEHRESPLLDTASLLTPH